MSRADEHLAAIRSAYARVTEAAAKAEAGQAPYVHALRERYDNWLDAEVVRLGDHHGRSLNQSLAAWEEQAWARYVPPDPTGMSMAAIRIGRYELPGTESIGDLPALLPIMGAGHVFVQGPDPAQARQFVHAAALRLTLTSPPGLLRLALIDSATSGSALATFLRLPTLLRGERIAVRPEEVDLQLKLVEDHLASVYQLRLTNVYPDIEAYNATAGVIRIPYHLLTITDLPAGFSDRSFVRLQAIAQNGPRAGVYILASLNPSHPMPRGAELHDLLALGTLLELAPDGRTSIATPGWSGGLPVILDQPPDPMRVNVWIEALASEAMQAASNLVFDRFAIPADARWQGNSTDGLSVPIGVTAAGEPWQLEIGRTDSTEHHGLVVGMPGSGKSNLLHVFITQLGLRYSPEELELYLLDFREGVGFEPYKAMPHVRALALESEREFALSILLHLQAEMVERGKRYKELAGGTVEQYPDYRRQSGQALPRKLLIMDEFQVLFREDDRLAQDAERVLTDLAKRARGFGIHLLLCSQSLNLATRSGSQVYNMMDIRIALRCAAQDSASVLGTDAASRLELPGDALINLEPGVHRVANLPIEERRRYLSETVALGRQLSYPRPFMFDSQAPADRSRNDALMAALAADDWPNRKPYVTAWLGEPVALGDPVGARIEREAGMNLLITGGRDEEAYGLLASALVSLAAQSPPSQAEFMLVDFARPDTPGYGVLDELSALLPHKVERVAQHETDALPEALAARLEARAQAHHASESHRHANRAPDLYVFVAGHHRWRALRSTDAYSQTDAGRQLARVAEDGPESGIHLILWTDSIVTLDRTLKRGAVNSFDLRVALRVTEGDSLALVGNNLAAKLEDNRAIFRNEADELGKLTKFKPYGMRLEGDLASFLAGLRTRQMDGEAA